MTAIGTENETQVNDLLDTFAAFGPLDQSRLLSMMEQVRLAKDLSEDDGDPLVWPEELPAPTVHTESRFGNGVYVSLKWTDLEGKSHEWTAEGDSYESRFLSTDHSVEFSDEIYDYLEEVSARAMVATEVIANAALDRNNKVISRVAAGEF